MSCIDAPLLNSLNITFYDQLFFDTLLLHDFIIRTKSFRALHQADVVLGSLCHFITLFHLNGVPNDLELTLGIQFTDLGLGLLSLSQVCSSALPPLPTLECLYIHDDQSMQQPRMLSISCVNLLCLFTSLKVVGISEKLVADFAIAFQELTWENRWMIAEVLPVLQNIFLNRWRALEYIKTSIGKFVSMRQRSGHPVAVHYRREQYSEYI
jgi:hypothetical protein